MGIINKALSTIIQRQKNAKQGKTNCIPCPFTRFSKDWAGIEKRKYIIIAGSDKSGKTQLASYLMLYVPLEFVETHPNVKVDILYFNMEESKEECVYRYISYLLRKEYDIVISKNTLLSTDIILPDFVLEKIQNQKIQSKLSEFEKSVTFSSKTTSTNIVNTIIQWNNQFGSTDEMGKFHTDHDDHYRIVFVDHIGLIDPEGRESLYETLRSYSKKCIWLRDTYDLTICNIQQCSAESEGLEAIKMDRLLPGKHSLADYKGTIRDCQLLLGVFNPSKVGNINNIKGYPIFDDISKKEILGDGVRIINIAANRDGPTGGVLGLYTDGSNSYFEEMPRPDSVDIQQYYNNIKKRRNALAKQKDFSMLNLRSINCIRLFKTKRKKSLNLKIFCNKILHISKKRKKFIPAWDYKSLPDELNLDGYSLIPMVCTDDDPCRRCFFQDNCDSIPCSPIVYWTPKGESKQQESVKQTESTSKKDENKTIGFKQNTIV